MPVDRKALVLALVRVRGRNHAGLKQELYREDTHVYSQNREQKNNRILPITDYPAMRYDVTLALAQLVASGRVARNPKVRRFKFTTMADMMSFIRARKGFTNPQVTITLRKGRKVCRVRCNPSLLSGIHGIP